MHDDYKPLDLSGFVSAPPNGRVLEPCPVCGSEAGLWQYSESETAPRKLLVMCSHGEKIGPQDGLIHEGCLLYMPGDNFYRETIRDAVRYWNEFGQAITRMRDRRAACPESGKHCAWRISGECQTCGATDPHGVKEDRNA